MKKALVSSAFFVFALQTAAAAELADSCRPGPVDAHAVVAHVYDGDTVRLEDGRKVRLIGINTPEIFHDGRRAEAFAHEARVRLAALLGEANAIGLIQGQDSHDRYGRLLAHAFLPDGSNLAALLLRDGLGAAITVPPNTALAKCYMQNEQAAREQGKGVWSLAAWQGEPAADLAPGAEGFHIIRGTVRSVKSTRNSIWLNLDGPAALRIDKRDLQYFSDLDPDRLEGLTVTARGWMRPYRKRTVMRVRHGSMLAVE